MSSSSLSSSSAIVVELAGFRSNGRKAFRAAEKSVHTASSDQAQMLSMRRHLSYQASFEIDNIEWVRAEYGEAVRQDLAKQIRSILNKEFGKLRVHRYRRLYVIRHRSVEGLISSLLRVQFHAHQIDLPVLNKNGDTVDTKPVTLTWGVGRTTTEAEVERLRRRRQKSRR